MKQVLAVMAFSVPAVEAMRSGHSSGADESSCRALDEGRRALLQARLSVFGVECEEMCKRMGEYPNCQCPGFEGSVASEGDMRMCLDKYCQDPSTPCPTDSFVTCVKEKTKTSLLQWGALLQRLGASLTLGGRVPRTKTLRSSATAGGSCLAQDQNHRAFLQAKLASFGVDCEEMCKKVGEYPKCQCPGFEGNPASIGDTRLCLDKFCQDPSTPCPTDSFVTCVRENTKVSFLQWPALLQEFEACARLWGPAQGRNVTTSWTH
mmetsp:Transcript_22043/g.66215  ORF Transcript_22043/g.66215 Transcript_22043/m.66215 type:complete len:263 (+) Transcript_22043:78-866(+)